MNKKGQSIQGLMVLLSAGILFVALSIVLSLGGDVISDVRAGQTENSTAWNISGNGLKSVNTLGDKMDTIALVVAVGVIISILIGVFAVRMAG